MAEQPKKIKVRLVKGVNCTREEKDQPPVCSNIGFACQPKAIRCLSAR